MADTLARYGALVSDRRAEDLLAGLVAIPSPSGDEKDAARYLADWMGRNGFAARIDASGSPIGVRGEGPSQIVLLGHIDTFPGQVPVRREGRRLFGRGAVDAKGPLAAFSAAAARITPPPGVQLVVIGATEEEAASSRGARHALKEFRPAAVIIGEPSSWDRVTLGYKGRLTMTWQWRGPLAHSASQVPSPAEVAVQMWGEVANWVAGVNGERSRAFERLDASLRTLNTAREGPFGRARAQINFRVPPGVRSREVEAGIRSTLTGGQVRFSGHEDAFIAEKNNPLVRALLAGCRAEGGAPRFVLKTGTSDMNIVGPVWGCPIAAYGPGDSNLDHTPDEHIDLDEYLRSIRVLRHALERLMQEQIQGIPRTSTLQPFLD